MTELLTVICVISAVVSLVSAYQSIKFYRQQAAEHRKYNVSIDNSQVLRPKPLVIDLDDE
jgi:hypothetical protein